MQAVVDDERAADPVVDPEQEEVRDVAGGAHAPLGDRREVDVVLHQDARADLLPQAVEQTGALPPRDVAGVLEAVGVGVVEPGAARTTQRRSPRVSVAAPSAASSAASARSSARCREPGSGGRAGAHRPPSR